MTPEHLQEANAFLGAFCTPEELNSITWQTFDDSEHKSPGLVTVRAGKLETHLPDLERVNGEGAGVFWTVNPQTDPRKRNKVNTARVRAVFTDLDGAPLEPVKAFALPPTAIIESSSGRYHAYWKVSDVPLLEFEGVQKRLAAHFNGDSKVCDLPRVMRFPYFTHNKGKAFRTKILELHPERVYTLEQLNAALPQVQATAPTVKPLTRATQNTSSSNDAQRKYVLTALESECNILRNAPEGQGNDQINKSAFVLGQLVGAGVISESEVRDALEQVVNSWAKPDPSAAASIRSGLEAGKLEPRDMSDVGKKQISETFQPEPLENVEEWQDRQPLGERPTVAALPLEMLPEVLQDWLHDAARLTCTPLEMVAANALCALSGVIGSAVTVQARAGFYVTPNIWGGAVASSGSMKTKLLNDATSPLRHLEREAAKSAEEENEDAELELSQAQKQADLLERRYTEKKALKGETVPTREQVKAARQEVHRLENAKPVERTYTTTNTTHEALGMLLLDNQKGMTVIRDELAPFIASMNRDDMAEARGFFNAAWDGSTPYTYHRVGRGKVRLERVCVAICGMIQPKLLDELIARMLSDPMQNDGFLQRFQVLVYPDTFPEWTPPEQQAPANTQALERVLKVVTRLNDLEQFGSDGNYEPRLLKFSSQAQTEFNQWHDTLERRIRPGGDLATDSAYKSWYAKSKSLCVSLATIFHLCDLADSIATWADNLAPIAHECLLMALDWCDYLNEHAKKIYVLELQPEQAAAQQVVKLIHDGRISDGNTLREVKRANRKLEDVIEQGLTVLERLGWLRLEEVNNGGRPSEVVRLHPDLITQALKSAAKKVGGF